MTEWLRSSPGKRVRCNSPAGSSPVSSAKKCGSQWKRCESCYIRESAIYQGLPAFPMYLHRPIQTMYRPTFCGIFRGMVGFLVGCPVYRERTRYSVGSYPVYGTGLEPIRPGDRSRFFKFFCENCSSHWRFQSRIPPSRDPNPRTHGMICIYSTYPSESHNCANPRRQIQ